MKTIFVLIFTFTASCIYAQQNIKIVEEPSLGGANEPTIYINPADTSNIVVGANINNVYHSFDGGRTWTANKLESQHGVWGDPAVTADSKGNFYFFHLSDPDGTNWESDRILDRIVMQKSNDGGKTWDEGVGIGLNAPKQQDKEWPAVHPETDYIAVTWTQFDKYGSADPDDKSNIMFSKSTDGGETWTEAKQINQYSGDCLDDDSTTEGAVPAWGFDNEIYVAWSFDSLIWFNRSSDGGETWMPEDLIIARQPGGWSQDVPGIKRANGFPVVKVDYSDKHPGRIYVNWTDKRNGQNDIDVFMIKSDNKGESWSDPVRINDDTVAAHQFFTWFDIDQTTGNLYAVFYDRREHLDENTDVYLAVSEDGGDTWKNQKISDSPFVPDPDVFFGDYNNISAHKGMIRPVWTRYEDGNLSLWTALLYSNSILNQR